MKGERGREGASHGSGLSTSFRIMIGLSFGTRCSFFSGQAVAAAAAAARALNMTYTNCASDKLRHSENISETH